MGETIALALAWFPADQYAAALERWPSLAGEWGDVPHADYCLHMEADLREYASVKPGPCSVAPIDVAEFVAWCEAEALHPEDSQARARYAAQLARTGRAIAWPPGRNDVCWCGRGRRYERCCGASPADG